MANKEALQAQVAAITAELASLNTQLAQCDCEPEFDIDSAYSVLESLREQPGVQALKHGTWQYLIEAKMSRFAPNGKVHLEVRKRRDRSVKLTRSFSPAFDTEANAKAAIQAVGEAAILAAMKALTADA